MLLGYWRRIDSEETSDVLWSVNKDIVRRGKVAEKPLLDIAREVAAFAGLSR